MPWVARSLATPIFNNGRHAIVRIDLDQSVESGCTLSDVSLLARLAEKEGLELFGTASIFVVTDQLASLGVNEMGALAGRTDHRLVGLIIIVGAVGPCMGIESGIRAAVDEAHHVILYMEDEIVAH